MPEGRDAATKDERAAEEREEGAGTGSPPGPGAEPPEPAAAPLLEGEALETFQRLAAETAEFRELTRRARADRDRLEQRGGDRSLLPDELLERLFPFLDGLQAAATSTGGDGFADGLEVLRRELASVLGGLGATRFAPLPGDPFNAGLMSPDQGEPAESAEVAEVLHPGWEIGGAVVAPARVTLRLQDADAAEAPSGGPEKG
jgi:molecular chaperone GrpE (heat shock protein)